MNPGWGAKLIKNSNSAGRLCLKNTLRGEPHPGMLCGESNDFSLMLEKHDRCWGYPTQDPIHSVTPLGKQSILRWGKINQATLWG